MKKIKELDLGFSDAVNYLRKENKELFNSIFIKNFYLDRLLKPTCYFLVGEKGTGKTAYSVFMANNVYKNNKSILKYIIETDYQKFITLKKNNHLELSDYVSIWTVIILLLLAQNISNDDLNHSHFKKQSVLKSLLKAIDEYFHKAFSPEIITILKLIEQSKLTAELISKYARIEGSEATIQSFQESRFQVNLMYIEKQFKEALSGLKLKNNQLLFIDGIDIRPGQIPFDDYLECVKGLANAVWNINTDFFSNIKDSQGRFKVVLLLRPDIMNSLGLHNITNKIRDNSVYLDWRTTYPEYRTSHLFELADRLIKVQQDDRETILQGACWDHYFPWQFPSTNCDREYDPSFLRFLKLCYSRPRDIVTIAQILQEEAERKNKADLDIFELDLFINYDFQNKYSEYLLGGIKDQLSFYYNETDFDMFIKFFSFLDGCDQFDYEYYISTYNKFIDHILSGKEAIPEFVDDPESFLQFLYESNIICYIEDMEEKPYFRWCYRERSPSNISPKVKFSLRYMIHYGLNKALNVGKQRYK